MTFQFHFQLTSVDSYNIPILRTEHRLGPKTRYGSLPGTVEPSFRKRTLAFVRRQGVYYHTLGITFPWPLTKHSLTFQKLRYITKYLEPGTTKMAYLYTYCLTHILLNNWSPTIGTFIQPVLLPEKNVSPQIQSVCHMMYS